MDVNEAAPSTQEQPAVASAHLSKEAALEACLEQHSTLISCFKTCGFLSSFTGCCTKEHQAFWGCYTQRRGTNETRIKSWLDGTSGGEQPG